MKNKGLVIGIVVVALICLTVGVVLIYTKDITMTTKVPDQKQTVNDEIINKLTEQLKIEGYILEYVKHEGNIYYFNQVDKDGKVGFEVQYDETTERISTVDKNEISEGQTEEDHPDNSIIQ